MKKTTLYILSIFVITIITYFVKTHFNNSKPDENMEQTYFEKSEMIKAEIEIFNGCGEVGVANLYANFLLDHGFDVIDKKNADNFDYLNTNIIVHKEDKMPIAKDLAEILKIKNIKLIKSGIWDLSLIIGKDYKELESFEIVKKYFSPF